MKNYKLNKKFQFLFPFLFIIGIILIIFGFNDKKVVDLNYTENNSIKYNVYLKENKFFDTPYLPEGRTYIASLIDYIDIFYHYDVLYNRKLTGVFKYKFVAQVRANKKEGSGYYWEKEYDLTKEKTIDIQNNVNVSIDDNVQVKYSTYNEILNNFKKEYGVNTDGELKVIMKISNNSKFEKTKEPVIINSEMNITIPLLEQAIEVAINKETSSNDNILSIKEKSDKPAYIIFKITGFVLMIVSILGFIDVTKTNIIFKRKNKYEIKLDNILTSYDSIIANIKTLPNLSSFKKIEVSTFEELLDVYNEVRMPINYCQEDKKSSFIIINDSIVWIYELKKDTMKWVDSNEKERKK
ncbi:MAG: hypothetical protein IJI49_01920 [Bacilli bacterium]|nr:hypothetical protein [Bacilli bacterium]